MPLSSFDRYFLNLPPFDRQPDFETFWKEVIYESKQSPLKPEMNQNRQRSTHRFTSHELYYAGEKKTLIKAELLIPKNTHSPKPIIHIHDYNRSFEFDPKHLSTSSAYLFIKLRGHDIISRKKDSEEEDTPGYMVENILDKNSYYLKSVYIDIFKAIDSLRLISGIDCSKIGIIGKGLGAAPAGFTAAFSSRVAAVFFDTPAFSYLEKSQNISESDATIEINTYISEHKTRKKLIKQNLSYFDLMNFADMIKCPVMTTVGFKDIISPPECVFALFNHLLCEKTIQVYPEEGNKAGGNRQFTDAVNWISSILNIKK